MPVVSNTSPILNLALIGELPLLKVQFGQVLIPPAVLNELRVDEHLPGVVSIRAALEHGWIRVVEVDNTSLVRVLLRELDSGESEAIALAIETGANTLLLDEREARAVAKSLGLNVTGVLGILLKARRHGYLQRTLAETIYDLKWRAHFHLQESLVRQILEEVDTRELALWIKLSGSSAKKGV